METFRDKLAVITGGGTGMGRELAVQLAGEGCHVAMCDVSVESMVQSRELCLATAPQGTEITTHQCDVADESQVSRFRDAVGDQHHSGQIHLLFNNAGIAGGSSFVDGGRAEWERTFGVCWGGVYNCTRAFLPMLIASDAAVIVNTSSVNGFWASMGPEIPHTAYSTAKFAVKGFTEALITDLRLHAPHVGVALVMPGHIGTDIVANTMRALSEGDRQTMSSAVDQIRVRMQQLGIDAAGLSDDAIRQFLQQRAIDFRDNAPLSAAEAATIILDGVRAGRWRILVGEDARILDQMVRADPENAYEESFSRAFREQGHFGSLMGGSQ